VKSENEPAGNFKRQQSIIERAQKEKLFAQLITALRMFIYKMEEKEDRNGQNNFFIRDLRLCKMSEKCCQLKD
jgi:hypothetical protein